VSGWTGYVPDTSPEIRPRRTQARRTHPAWVKPALVAGAKPSTVNLISATGNPRHVRAKTKPSWERLLNRDGGSRRPGAGATECQLNTLTGRVLASPKLHCASGLTLRRHTHPAKFDLAPVASAPPTVDKLSSTQKPSVHSQRTSVFGVRRRISAVAAILVSSGNEWPKYGKYGDVGLRPNSFAHCFHSVYDFANHRKSAMIADDVTHAVSDDWESVGYQNMGDGVMTVFALVGGYRRLFLLVDLVQSSLRTRE